LRRKTTGATHVLDPAARLLALGHQIVLGTFVSTFIYYLLC
jgi:hypothetical protein